MELDLWSPFLDLHLEGLSRNEVIAAFGAWFVFWIVVMVGIIWLYSVWFAGVVGFQTAVLVGLALLVLGQSAKE